MDARQQLALTLARQAGTIIRENFGKQHAISRKGDLSPVTATDQHINAVIVAALQRSFPDDGLLGEEESYGTGKETYQWVCDPLDGTKPFILEVPCSLFMLALSTQGHILLSVAFDPFADKLYHAIKGNGAYCNNRRINVSNQTIDEGFALVGPDSLPFAAELKRQAAGIEAVAGTGYKCMKIAEGKGIGMINDAADFHDIGPASLIIEEAGGKVTGLDGGQLKYSGGIGGVIVSNGIVHKDFIAIARRCTAV